MPDIVIPCDLLPADGRFGAGPAKVPTPALDALAATGTSLMGTSHRQAPVRNLVGRVTEQLRDFLDVPADHAVVMGNGGSTAFWDMAAFCLVESKAQHASYGEFTAKFATVTRRAPFLAEPSVVSADPGSLATCRPEEGVDTYAWAQNETSTAVMAPVRRVAGTGLMLVDATSGVAGLPVDLTQCDAYYFAPQKGFASDGGLWVAVLSPAAQERARRIKADGRWIPAFLDLPTAMDNAEKNQTYNTPAVATLFLMAEQLSWMLERGGLEAMVTRTADSSRVLYDWAQAREYAAPFVAEPSHRSQVIATIDLHGVDGAAVCAALRANGLVDTEPYRGLGRNQLRIATYPAIEPSDVAALTQCVDFVVDALG